jgi:hypothetical protein
MRAGSLQIPAMVVALLSVAIAEAGAQEWVHLRPLQGKAFLQFDGTWRYDEDDASGSRDLEFSEGFELKQAGHILHPRLAAFALSVSPQLSQTDLHIDGGEDEQTTADILSYDGTLSLFQGSGWPVGLVATAGKSSSDTNGERGSRSDQDSDFANVALRWQQDFFPTTLRYSQRRSKRTFRSGLTGRTTSQDDLRRTLQLKADSSKMSVSLQRDWIENKQPGGRDSTYDQANLSHKFQWGKGSTLNSRFAFTNRDDFNVVRSYQVSETVRIRHLENLTSNTGYNFSYTDTQATESRNVEVHSGNFNLNHRLYRNLNTSFSANGSTRKSGTSNQDRYGASARSSYNKRIPWGGNLNLSAGGGYTVVDRTSKDGLVQVLDEPQAVAATTFRFLLDERFVDISTIFVKDGNGPGAFVFPNDGSAYTVASVGNDLTEISIVPGGPIDLAAPIALFIDYQFQSLPTLKYATTSYNYGVNLNFGWIDFFHSYSRSGTQRIKGASESFLSDEEEIVAGLRLRWSAKGTAAGLGAQYSARERAGFDSETFSINENVSHTLSRRASLNFDATQSFSEGEGIQSESYTADLSASWSPRPGLVVLPRLGFFWRRDDAAFFNDTATTEIYTASLDVRWNFRKIALDLQYQHSRREGDGITTTDSDRVFFKATRRF